MKTLIKLLLLVIVVALAALAWTHAPIKLDVAAERDWPTELPPAQPPSGMAVSVISTGQMQAGQAFAYRGGSFLKQQLSAMDVVLVKHPAGDLLIDTGFGRDVAEHFTSTPWLMQALASFELNGAVADQLQAGQYNLQNLKGVLLTHAHWDHVSGIPDLPGTPVWVNQKELDFIRSGAEHAALVHSFGDEVNYRTYEFSDPAYMGYASSLDVYKDGSIVLVPMYGHTPGSTGIFITLPSGKRFFFIGDTVWVREGYERPAERPLIPRLMIGEDAAQVRQEIAHVHRLHRQFPALVIVPAHDRRQFADIVHFPDTRR